MLQQKKGNNEIIQIILDMTIKKSILIFFLLYLFYEGAANTLIWQIFFSLMTFLMHRSRDLFFFIDRFSCKLSKCTHVTATTLHASLYVYVKHEPAVRCFQ